MDSTDTPAGELVRRYIDLWNRRDYAELEAIVSKSYVLRDPAAPGGEARGAEGAEAWLRQIVGGFPDFEIEILDLLADETTAMVELEYTGTHRGEFQGVPPTGRRVELRGMERHRVVGDRLDETRVCLDNHEFRDQLGLAFPEVLVQLPTLAWAKLTEHSG
jgi:steroid delta-isomerase-like uncharacterized protein